MLPLFTHTPPGAVPAGSTVTFTLRPPRAEGFSSARLTLTFEQDGGRRETLPLPWTGREGALDCFSQVFSLPEGYTGLVWCAATLTGLDGREREEGPFQLTVYDDSAAVPSWFGEGVTYQIFPDRFCRTAVPGSEGLVGGRTVHRSWDDVPEWRPDEKGEVRNRDFFGGSLAGILEKLPYLEELGVETVYLCPIFEGAENHRYGTGDYEKIDPMLGTQADFEALCDALHRRGMKLILDGVFSHTGFVSRYFNGDGSYPGLGAAQSTESPFFSWYTFTRWPHRYDSWWGIYSLPAVNELDEGYLNYIVRDKNSIVRRWLRAGADGWRLDVADELPDPFIAALRQAAREEKPDAVVLGEVWEDGSNKMAYGVRRKHLWGGHLDGLMNYPFRTGLLTAFQQRDWTPFARDMETLMDHYPPFAFWGSMNFLGTHDTPRILSALGAQEIPPPADKEGRASFRLPPDARARARARVKAAAAVLYAFPGSPTLYYGDEWGLEGFEDPFNRGTVPWGRDKGELWQWFAALGKLRRQRLPLRKGDLRFLCSEGPLLAFSRTWGEETVVCCVNLDEKNREIPLPDELGALTCLAGTCTWSEGDCPVLPPVSAALFSTIAQKRKT